jgi:hypothetical protein
MKKPLRILSATLLFAGCTSDPEPPVTEPMQCDIPKLFEEQCGGSICHGAGESTAAGLDLTSPGVEERVSGAPGASCMGVLADPANPESSLLYQKVLTAPTCGARMPLNGEPLDEDELGCLRDWISGLLPPSGDGCEGCVCEPGVVEDCYGGPEGTADVGVCASGSHTCQTSGMGWTACEGEVGPRGEDCFTVDVDENCDGETPECTETWALGFGDPLNQAIRSVAVDSAGNIYSLGDFEGVVGFGGDPLTATPTKADLVVTKHDKYGNPLWSRRWGDSSNQYGGKLILDAEGNLVFTGRIYGSVDFGGGSLSSKGAGDLLIVKLDGEGEHVWSHVFGDKDPERSERLVIDNEGDVIVTGTFTTTADFGGNVLTSAGMRDAFVLELDGPTGNHVWSRRFGAGGDDYGFAIDVDPQGNIMFAGRFQDDIEIGEMLSSAGGRDIFLAKLDSFGEPLWSRSFGGPGEDEVHDLALQANGDIVMVGGMADTMSLGGPDLVSAGERDIFVATLDSAGNHVWSARYGDAIDQFTSTFEINSWLTLALGQNGEILVGGSLLGTLVVDGNSLEGKGMNSDVFYFMLAADGSFLAGDRWGGTNTDLGLDVVLAGPDHAVMAGRSYGTEIDFGAAGRVANHGNGDGFIVKFALP